MITYLVDGRALQDGSSVRGIGTYVRGILGGLGSLGVDGVGLLLERGAGPSGDLAHLPVHPTRLRVVNRHLRPLFDPIQVRHALASSRPRLYHAVEYAQPFRSPVPVVVTVHDLIPFVLPASYPWMRRERLLAMRQLKAADAVIAVSASTAADLQEIARVDPGRITVIHEGVAPVATLPETAVAAVRERLRLPKRFLLAVGTFDPRKRVELLTDVVARVRREHEVGLVIAGFQGNFAAAVDEAVASAGLGPVTRVLGHISRADLAALYQATDCLVFTSAYEGFGLPPLEAMAGGAPVAAFDNSSLAEVVGEVGELFPDGDAEAMASGVTRLLDEPSELQRRAERGRSRAATFSWERAARETFAVYAAALGSR